MFPIGFYSHFNHIILPFKKHLCGARKKTEIDIISFDYKFTW